MPEPDDSLLGDEKRMVANFKKAVLMAAGGAAQKLGLELGKHQETLMHTADMVIDTYLAESVLLRTLKLAELKDAGNVPEQIAMCQLYIHDAADRIHKWAKEAVNNFADGDEQRAMLMGAKRFTKASNLNTAELRKLIAKKMIAEAHARRKRTGERPGRQADGIGDLQRLRRTGAECDRRPGIVAFRRDPQSRLADHDRR